MIPRLRFLIRYLSNPRAVTLLAASLCLPAGLTGCAWSHWQDNLSAVPPALELTTDARVSMPGRLRLSASTPLVLASASTPASRETLLSARAGLRSRFAHVSVDESGEGNPAGVLLIVDDGREQPRSKRSGWSIKLLPLDALLPASAKGKAVRVHFIDLATGMMVGRADIAIDPPLFRPVRTDLTQFGFEALATSLTGA